MIFGTDRIIKGYTKQIHEQGRRGQWEKALNSLRDMQQRGLEPNEITYNALIGACKYGRNVEKAMELFAEMQQRGLEPNVITYTALISACDKGHKAEKAMEVFVEMQQRGLEPNVITYNALISACEKDHQAEKAMELFAEMQQRGLVPDAITYTALISACEKGHNAEKAMELFVEMQQRSLVPDAITYTALISACEKGRKAETPLELCVEMQQKDLEPVAVACNFGIGTADILQSRRASTAHSLSSNQRVMHALHSPEQMQDLAVPGCRCGTMPFNAVEVVASQCGFLSCTVVQPRTYHWPTSRFRLSRRVCPFVQRSPPGKIPPDPLKVPLTHSRKKGRGWNKIPKTLTWLSTGMPELPVTL